MKQTTVDTAAAPAGPHVQSINLPHADSALAPVLAKVMDAVFEASKIKLIHYQVIFVSKNGVNQNLFGFLPLQKDDYKIVDVTSNLDAE